MDKGSLGILDSWNLEIWGWRNGEMKTFHLNLPLCCLKIEYVLFLFVERWHAFEKRGRELSKFRMSTCSIKHDSTRSKNNCKKLAAVFVSGTEVLEG